MTDILQNISFILMAFLLGVLVGICIWEFQRQMRSGKYVKAYCPNCKKLNNLKERISLEYIAIDSYECDNCSLEYTKLRRYKDIEKV